MAWLEQGEQGCGEAQSGPLSLLTASCSFSKAAVVGSISA